VLRGHPCPFGPPVRLVHNKQERSPCSELRISTPDQPLLATGLLEHGGTTPSRSHTSRPERASDPYGELRLDIHLLELNACAGRI
jgi:hypothetical protein